MRNETTASIRRGALSGAVVPVVFFGLVLLAASQYDGYSHLTQKISELGGPEATSAWIQNLNFLVLGVLILGLVWALARHDSAFRLGGRLLGVFGLVAVLHAFLPCDPGCAGQTAGGLAHNITGVIGFLSTIASMTVLARRWRATAGWHDHARFTQGIRWVAIAGLVWFIATQAADAQATAGIAQRLLAGALVVWIGATGWRLHQVASSDQPLSAGVS